MKYQAYNLGYVHRGSVVEVTLRGSAANVRLMDSANFNAYKSGRRHRYIGGLIGTSPSRMEIPSSGNWYVTIDMQGLRGVVRSSVRVIPREIFKPLPEFKAAPLRDIPTLLRNLDHGKPPQVEGSDTHMFDVFISHTSEDKEDIVRPLAETLRAGGLSVWFDEFEMKIGDSLRQKIDKGIANSRFGIVVFSRAFLGRGWPEYELDGIVTQSVSGKQILLPIWHNISKREVMEYSPSLANRLARSTSTQTVEEISAEIIELIRS